MDDITTNLIHDHHVHGDGRATDVQLARLIAFNKQAIEELKNLTASQQRELLDLINKRMETATYDSDEDGIVDNAEKVNGHTVDADVPANAVFTDTTYKISQSADIVTLTGSDKNNSTVDLSKTSTGQKATSNAKAISDETDRATAAEKTNSEAITAETERATAAEKTNSDAIGKLNADSTTEGSVAYQVTQAIAALVNSAPDDLDTLKEIADWITSHAESASAMNTQIKENTTAISKETTRAEAAEKANADAIAAEVKARQEATSVRQVIKDGYLYNQYF